MLPQICALSHACLKQTHYLLNGLEVDEEAMRRNLALSRGAVVSEAVMMGLGKTIGRQNAHDIVYEYVESRANRICCAVLTDRRRLCRKAELEDKSLLELLQQNEEIKKAGLSNKELESLCDPANYLGLSEVMIDRVLMGSGEVLTRLLGVPSPVSPR